MFLFDFIDQIVFLLLFALMQKVTKKIKAGMTAPRIRPASAHCMCHQALISLFDRLSSLDSLKYCRRWFSVYQFLRIKSLKLTRKKALEHFIRGPLAMFLKKSEVYPSAVFLCALAFPLRALRETLFALFA